jgi:hypothetical protein
MLNGLGNVLESYRDGLMYRATTPEQERLAADSRKVIDECALVVENWSRRDKGIER